MIYLSQWWEFLDWSWISLWGTLVHFDIELLRWRHDKLYFPVVKVSWFRNVFLVSSNFPRNERKQFDLRYQSSKVEFFCSFFGRIEDRKSPFEINWPLTSLSGLSAVNKTWRWFLWKCLQVKKIKSYKSWDTQRPALY